MKYCSLWRRIYGKDQRIKLLSEWPISEPEDYLSFIKIPQPKEEEEKIRLSVVKGKPFGNDNWSIKIIKKFGLESTIRAPWRPKKST